LMKISSKMAFENFKNFISFHETFKTKFSTHISICTYPRLSSKISRRSLELHRWAV